MIGSRLKLIRQAHAMSLQDLSEQLSLNSGISIHRSALFGYENGRSVPGENTLQALAQELGVPTDFFDQEEWADFHLHYFHCPQMAAQRQQETDAYVKVKLERHRILDTLLGCHSTWGRPSPLSVTSEDKEAVEDLAQQLRVAWNLGIYPISSVCGLLESIGWYLLVTPNNLQRLDLNSTESCGCECSSHMPFIVYNSTIFPDELRYKLLKYVGYAYIQGRSPKETDEIAGHFSRALLLSKEQLTKEVGSHRTEVSEAELSLLKQKYGIPRRLIMYRLYELGIISEACYRDFTAYLRQNLFLKREGFMGSHFSYEVPAAYDLKLYKAQSERLLPTDMKDFFAR